MLQLMDELTYKSCVNSQMLGKKLLKRLKIQTIKLQAHAGSTEEIVQENIIINIIHYQHQIFLLDYKWLTHK